MFDAKLTWLSGRFSRADHCSGGQEGTQTYTSMCTICIFSYVSVMDPTYVHLSVYHLYLL